VGFVYARATLLARSVLTLVVQHKGRNSKRRIHFSAGHLG
jgi:hypothetical protein